MTKKTVLGWLRLAALVIVCAVLGVAAYMLAGRSWDAVVDYRSPYASIALEPGEAGSAVASRTVLVIIDGLRLDSSRQMGTLNHLRGYGADLELVAPQPSLSYPNWTTIVSGAPPYVSGVVTNWHEGGSPVETLFDTVAAGGVKTVFVGPSDFSELYGVDSKVTAAYQRDWDTEYLSGTYVDEALRLAGLHEPALLVVHLPDIDEAGHSFGGASDEYARTVSRVDQDLGRLVDGLQDGGTVFAVVADHGHIDTGGHGGWESVVTSVPGVFSGPGIRLGSGTAELGDVAATVSVLVGAPAPAHSAGLPIAAVVGEGDRQWPVYVQSDAFWRAYADVVGITAASPAPQPGVGAEATKAWAQGLEDERLARDRSERIPFAAAGFTLALLAIILIAIASPQAFAAVVAGTAVYYTVYNVLFFAVHGNRWSLSSFNSEDLIGPWMNQRMIEASVALLLAAATAAAVYPMLRRLPKPPAGRYLSGWLSIGPATALVILATLGLQVSWFVWWWGIDPVWRLPDLMWAFKYDLDLVQATAVGLVALITPLVTYVVGRYHPKVRESTTQE